MKVPQKYQTLLLLGLALALGAMSLILPRLLRLSEHLHPQNLPSASLAPEAYATMLGLFLSGLALGAIDPSRWVIWGIIVGLAPLMGMIGTMVQQGSPGNLWPIAIVLSTMIGVPLALLGTRFGMIIQQPGRPPENSNTAA